MAHPLSIAQLMPADYKLTEGHMWQVQLARDEKAATPRSRHHLAWANACVVLDIFSLGSPLGWTSAQSYEERFEIIREHFRRQLLDALEIFRREVAAGDVRDPVGNFRKRVQGAMRRHYYDAYAMGRTQSDPYWRGFDWHDLDKVRAWIEREYEYLRGWMRQLRDLLKAGQTLPGNLDYRASLYGNSLRNSYLSGIVDGAHEEDSVTILEGIVKTEHCKVCPDYWGTYTLAEYEALGGPPPMWCEGLTNCKCIVQVNHAMDPDLRYIVDMVKTLGDVETAELPLPLAFWRQENRPTPEEIEAWAK